MSFFCFFALVLLRAKRQRGEEWFFFSFERSGSGAKKPFLFFLLQAKRQRSEEALYCLLEGNTSKKTNAPSLPAADAGLLAEQLGHDLAGGNVLRQRVDVVPVGRADVVGLLQEAVLFFFFRCRERKGGGKSVFMFSSTLSTPSLPLKKTSLSYRITPVETASCPE